MSKESNIPEKPGSYSHLFFSYNATDKQISFSSEPINDFFELDIRWHQPFPFANPAQTYSKDLEKHWNHCQHLKEKETGSFCFETTTPDGLPVVFSFDAIAITAPAYGDTPMVFFSVKKLKVPENSRAESKTADNDRKDYAEFIDLAAHDLDAPLRKISLLIDRMIQKNTTEPGSDLQGYFDRVQTSLTEMRTLIDNLSAWASLKTATRHLVPCDIHSIVNEAIAEIRHKSPDRQITASFTGLPVLNGDKTQYRQLFQALLQNVVTYSKRDQPVQIQITGEPLENAEKCRLSLPADKEYSKIIVTDNGIGFEQQYAEHIFRPFTRLHGKSEYPGSGMGLAICKKIAQNHEGIIYAESKEDNGASFTVILPQSF